MKEFEKWNAKNCGGLDCSLTHDAGCDACTELKKIGWEAALKMLAIKLEQMVEPPSCRCIQTIQEIIKEEIEK